MNQSPSNKELKWFFPEALLALGGLLLGIAAFFKIKRRRHH